MTFKPLIKESLFLLNIFGVHPYSQNVWSKIKACIMATLLAVLFVELSMEAIFHSKGLEVLLPVAGFVTVQLQAHRFIILIICRERFVVLLDRIEKLFYAKVQRSYQRLGKKMIKCAIGIPMVFSGITYLIPIVIRIIWSDYPFDNYPFYHYSTKWALPYFVIQNILFFLGIGCLIIFTFVFDFLFLSFIVYFLLELKTLKEEIKIVVCRDEEVSLKRVELIVKHHNLVLRTIKYMNGIYSGEFLNLFLCTAIGLCGSLVSITTRSSGQWVLICALLINFLLCLSELFACCMGGTILSTECEEISSAVYESKWWIKAQPKVCRSLALIIQRAQKETYLNAMGVFPMNFQCFASVMKMAYSFYSVAQSTGKK